MNEKLMKYNETNKQINKHQASKFEIPLTNVLISKPCLNLEKNLAKMYHLFPSRNHCEAVHPRMNMTF